MRVRFILLGTLASCLSVPALAAPVQAPAPVHGRLDPVALKAADQMLTAMGYNRMMQRTADALVAQMGPMFQKAIEEKTGEAVDDALIKRLTSIEADFMQRTIVDSADVRRAIATLYASEFTAAELNHLAALFNDPVMRKWSEVAPEMTAKMFPLVQGVVQSQQNELETQIKAAVTDYYDEKTPVPHS